jgi:hypothetical protein
MVTFFQLKTTANNIETQLCIAATSGKHKVIALAKEAKYRDYNNVNCNGKSITEFAQELMK